jgi:ABC-2 type transport system permease protein
VIRGLGSLSRAMMLGFVRDRAALFFTILFPLMFLVLFGGLFKDTGTSKPQVVEIGAVALFDQMPPPAREQLDGVLTIVQDPDRDAALDHVRKGDYSAAIEQQGSTIVLHYSAQDAVRSGIVQGVLTSVVNNANLVSAGVTTPRFSLAAEQVEDRSLKTIQFVTPGLLGWAIAVGATFGAAMTLVTWRQKRILRRLRLAPVRTTTIVGARVAVSIGIALVQMIIFLGIASLPYFGLKLSHAWWMAVPLIIAATLAFMSIGLLAGSFAKTPEAASAIANLIVLPMAFLSGSFFPLDDAPAWLRTVSQVFPLKHLNEAMLDVMVRGEGAGSALPAIGVLLGFALVVGAIASLLFRWDDV